MQPTRFLVLLAALVFSALPASAVTLEPVEFQVPTVYLSASGSGGSVNVTGPPPQTLAINFSSGNCTATGTVAICGSAFRPVTAVAS